MSQHDFNIANQSFPATRTDLNNALQALASNSSGDAEPSTTFANQWWYETDTNTLKLRNEANNAWLSFATVDQTTGAWTLAHDVIFGDNDKAIFGAGSDLQIYHSSTDSFIDEDGTGRLYLRSLNGAGINLQDATGNMIRTTSSGSVDLYYANALKLATTATGIDVTGTAVTDGLTVAGNLSVDGGTIKLDGNYPVGTSNVALGDAALDSLTSGGYSTAVGHSALTAVTSANGNVAVGFAAGDATTTGDANVAVGTQTFTSNTSGANNTALGYQSLSSNTTASENTAVGYQAAYSNTTGTNSDAFGYRALYTNTTGAQNVAIGSYAGFLNTTGINNVSLGYGALLSNTTASNNTAVGYQAGYTQTTSGDSTYLGYQAGYSRTGSGNTCIGNYSGRDGTTGTDNTLVGRNSGYTISSGSKNTIIGMYNGNYGGLDIRTSSNNIVLSDGDGNPRMFIDASGDTMFTDNGDFSIFGSGVVRIRGQAGLSMNNRSTASTPRDQIDFYDDAGDVNGSITSTATSNTTAYNTSSDSRLKTNVETFDAMALVNQMNPVQYNRIGDLDAGVDRLEYGFLAQELHTVFPQAVHEGGEDPNKEPWQLDYAKLTGVLTKAIQEQQATIEALEARLAALESA